MPRKIKINELVYIMSKRKFAWCCYAEDNKVSCIDFNGVYDVYFAANVFGLRVNRAYLPFLKSFS